MKRAGLNKKWSYECVKIRKKKEKEKNRLKKDIETKRSKRFVALCNTNSLIWDEYGHSVKLSGNEC